METIKYDRKENWWNGKVLIDELKIYKDERGMVCETFRDDDALKSKMCYISETQPFVLRGPHEHTDQKDVFVSWKTSMVYQMYNKESNETKYFITNPNTITRVFVDIGIVHSYRNLSFSESHTLNFPDQLFMGVNKQGWKPDQKIDEIRHEDVVKPICNIYVLGANGRLGEQLIKQLYKNVGYHNYNIIPIVERFKNLEDLKQKIKLLEKVLKENKIGNDDIIINCIAKTTGKSEDEKDYYFSNYTIPMSITEMCIRNKIKLLHFSTDYVYQTGNVGAYTRSKVLWEQWYMNDSYIYANSNGILNTEYEKLVKVIRVANLFSQKFNDTSNIICKLNEKFKNGKISYPTRLAIMPTDVDTLCLWIVNQYLPNFKDYNNFINVSGKCYSILEIMDKFTNYKNVELIEIENQDVINNPSIFLNSQFYYEINCDIAISKKFDTINTQQS